MTRAHEPGEGRGWIEFVGLFFIVAGAFNVIAGIAALSRPDVFREDAALIQHMSFWAWVWFALAEFIIWFVAFRAFPLWSLTLFVIYGFILHWLTAYREYFRWATLPAWPSAILLVPGSTWGCASPAGACWSWDATPRRLPSSSGRRSTSTACSAWPRSREPCRTLCAERVYAISSGSRSRPSAHLRPCTRCAGSARHARRPGGGLGMPLHEGERPMDLDAYAGNINEGDYLSGEDVAFPEVAEGDIVAMVGIGGYCQSMWTHHCGRPRAGALFFEERA